MRLKELRIKGFKSFANDTRVLFKEQIIGVVGPNGSGKSNIVDAVKWVLGEQKNRDLRADTMIDVIFNGTQTRKKAGMAEVSMVFDNTKNILPTEYKQVEVTRLLYRSGDSEYQLNGTKCRRKDILNLFLDSGIGSNSYAIIQLGMVDDILFDKDNARHKMFEQAAGISKFKVRKRETLLKLKSTEIDLERIKDILHELEINMKSLEKQAKRTKRYYELKEKYKTLSIELAAKSFHHKTDQLSEEKTKLTQEEDAYRSIKNKLTELEAQLEQARAENLEKEQSLSENQKKFNQLSDNLRVKENDKQINEQELNFSQNALRKIELGIEHAQSELNNLRDQLNPLHSDQLQLQSQLDAEMLGFKSIEKRYNEVKSLLASVQGDEASNISILQEYENKVFDLEKKLVVSENDLERTQSLLANLREQLSKNDQEGVELQSRLKEVSAQEDTLKAEIDGIEKRLAEARERMRELDQLIEQKSDELFGISRKLDSKQNEHNLIKDMIDNLEGFPDSAKFLVEKWKNIPLLSNIIDCRPDYRAGLEFYLQSFLNHFVVDNYEEGIAAIQFLNQSQKGKAQFFLLNRIPSYLAPANTRIPGAIPATSVLHVDEKYKPLMQSLLNNVFFVENWQDSYYQLLDDEKMTIIDKGGRFIINRKQMTGGSVGLFEGMKLGREKTLEKLAEDISSLTRQRQTVESSLDELRKERDVLVEEIKAKEENSKNEQLERLTTERVQIETQLSGKTDQLSTINSDITLHSNAISEFKTQIESLRGQNQTARQELDRFRSEREVATGEIDKIMTESQDLSERYNAANILVLKVQNQIETLQQDASFKQERIQRLEETVVNNSNERSSLSEKIAQCKTIAGSLEEELTKLYTEKEAMSQELNLYEQNYFSERSEINELENEAQKKRRELNEKQLYINEFKSDLQNLEFDIQGIRERLSIEFSMDKEEIQTLLQNAKGEEIEEGMEEKVARLKHRLENYGDINPMAVQAFDEIQERFLMIEGQRDDIVNAKASLLETIEEIEASASDKFLNAYNKVNDNFKVVFRSLFTEDDSCELILTDPENPLESKIEIIAKPKGKRPRTLKQLSGGEMTLTATALLFSLYLLKPAPFCIFDEVDAPLDDHNIRKFTNLIREFSTDSQFIIITHNKSTMAAVDTLYGVFMQEKGVSGITEVDFREYEHNEIFQSANVN